MVTVKKGAIIEQASPIDDFLKRRKNKDKIVITEGKDTINRKGKSFHKIEGSARDIRTSNLSQKERTSLLEDAKAKGFFAIDEGDHIHVDVGTNLPRSQRHDVFDALKEDKRGILARGKDATDMANKNFVDRLTSLDAIVAQKDKEKDEDQAAEFAANQLPEGDPVATQVGGTVLTQTDSGQRKVASAAEKLPENVRRTVVEDMKNPEKVTQSIQRSKQSKITGEGGSIKDNFMDAVTFFLPTAIGALAGGLIEGGEGAVAGAQQGTQLAQGFRDFQLKKEELGLKSGAAQARAERQAKQDKIAKERLENQGKQLEARQEEIRLQKERSKNLEEDREIRRDERDLERASKIKDAFVKRKDVTGSIQAFEDLNSLEDLVKIGTKLPGAAQARVARVISGEVGTLNEGDIERAQINPDFLSQVKRDSSIFFKGELTEKDKSEILKIVTAIRAKKSDRFKGKIEGFVNSRSKGITNKANKKALLEDLMAELPVVRQTESKVKGSDVSVQKQLDIIKRIKARRK